MLLSRSLSTCNANFQKIADYDRRELHYGIIIESGVTYYFLNKFDWSRCENVFYLLLEVSKNFA